MLSVSAEQIDPEVTVAQLGKDVEIYCNVVAPSLGEHSYSQNVSWYHTPLGGGKHAPLESAISNFEVKDLGLIWGGQLTLKQFTEDNTGVYTCHGISFFGQNLIHETKVLKPGNFRGIGPSQVSLHCSHESNLNSQRVSGT